MLLGTLIVIIVFLMVVKPTVLTGVAYHGAATPHRRPVQMPSVATSPTELLAAIAGSAHLDGERLVIDDEAAFRDARHPRPGLDRGLLDRRGHDRRRAVAGLGGEPGARAPARRASRRCTRPAPAARSPGSRSRRINLRTQTFDMARTVYEAAEAADVAAVILELARSEQTYTFQRPIDYATSVLAGAIAAGWQGPVFIQGDHYQFNAKKYAADPEAMTEEIRRACRLAVDAGYRNIDIDSSTLVDLSKPTVDEQQRENYVRAAELTALIRTLETDGVTISVGGEIGEVGTQNSTVEELRAYLDGYRRELEARAPGATGISKVSVQTGTSHGGVPLPDGGVAEVKLDFEVLRELGVVAREYGLAGAVQHGASTLPDELFHRFPAVETAEIHLATGFQNALYEHPAFPRVAPPRDRGVVLRQRAPTSASPARPTSSSSTRTRKKALGPFKRQLWELESKDEILAAQRRKISYLFTELRVNDSREMVEQYIQPVELHRPIPDALRGAVAAALTRSRVGRPRSRESPLETTVDRVRSGAILPRRSSGGLRDPAQTVPGVPVCHPRGQLAPIGAEVGRRTVAGQGESAQDIAARDDAHLRVAGHQAAS